MKACPVFAIVGTITAVGPSMLHDGGVLFRHIDICEKGGEARRLTSVRAVEAIASLIEQHAIGIFLFWERQDELLLWYEHRADGAQVIDFKAIRAYEQERGRADAS